MSTGGRELSLADGTMQRMTTTTAALTASEEALRPAAQEVLAALAGPTAVLRDDQLRAIAALVSGRRRVLVVQRTGWGKSAVYFVATKLLRDRGEGPTLIVSPLLALMRDQLAAAARAGLRAATVNSTNREQWDQITAQITAGETDLLLVSPERLNHPGFRREVLGDLAGRTGLLVVDEAHCISDWGHDFRPDYRRIRDVLAGLDPATPVLATTATANDRVVADVEGQLGTEVLTLRGTLDRESLHLGVVDLRRQGDDPARLAWLAEWLPTTTGSGIVYALTVADAHRVATYLQRHGIEAAAYTGQTEPAERERIEADLAADRLKAVCATSALGMGYDKPDLGFVVHFGCPSSPIAYYQAIGRAGRAVARADVIVLPGVADEAIWSYFDATAFPPEEDVRAVLDHLAGSERPVPVADLEQIVNLRRGRLEAMLKILDVDGAVERVAGAGGGWRATGADFTYDTERYAGVAAARRAEQQVMRDYLATSGCRMAFLRRQLDDPATSVPGTDERCGRCDRCAPPGPAREIGADAAPAAATAEALAFLREVDVPVEPRKQWPRGLKGSHGRSGNLKPAQRSEQGRALTRGQDAAWREVVGPLLVPDRPDDPVPDAVLDGLSSVLARWSWPARPTWVTAVPSRARPLLVASVADRLAALGRLERRDVVVRQARTPPQRTLQNSLHQAAAALDAFAVDPAHDGGGALPAGPVLLVDDTIASGWTLTVVGVLLREAGADAVLPLVLRRDT